MTAIQPQSTELQGRPVSPGTAEQSTPAGKANYVTGIADGNLATPVKLRDFLFGLGVVYRLPKRAKVKPEAKGGGKRRFAIRIPVKPIAMAFAPVVVAVGGYFGYQQFSGVPLPANVVGTWSTQDGRYKGRNFWLNPEAVAFQNGNSTSQFSVHPIKKVRTFQNADTLMLNIDYESDGKPVTLALSFRDLPRPELRLVNQPKVHWLRTGNAPVVRQ